MASRRSQRTEDGTPLSIIQDELFELQRQRKQIELQTPKGPPPDMPYYATVTPPPTPPPPPSNNYPEPTKIKSAMKKQHKNKRTKKHDVDFREDPIFPHENAYDDRPNSMRRVKIGIVLTLILFVCMYVYPLVAQIPHDKRMSSISTLSIAIGLGAFGASLWPQHEKQ
jgi:hypothetical protein